MYLAHWVTSQMPHNPVKLVEVILGKSVKKLDFAFMAFYLQPQRCHSWGPYPGVCPQPLIVAPLMKHLRVPAIPEDLGVGMVKDGCA